jgi:hypothetical protein
MNKAALALVLIAVAAAAMAATVQASTGDSNSLLQCGVNLGGKTLTYNDEPEAKRKPDNRMNHVLGAVAEKPLQFTPVMAAETASGTTHNSDRRLPPKFTLAIIGCSWR